MTVERHVTHLEKALAPTSPEAPVRIELSRIPGDVPDDLQQAWAEQHPECVTMIWEVIPGEEGVRVIWQAEGEE